MRKTHPNQSGTPQRLRRIEGKHNPLLKELRQAFAHAERTVEGDFAVEGFKIIEEAMRSGVRLRAVFFRDSAMERAERLLPQIGAQVETISLPDKLFDDAVPSDAPQGVAALVRTKQWSLDDILERLQVGPILVTAGLQDPGNLGTILRSAEAFGCAGVVIGEGTVSPFNSKVVRASAGSMFRIPWILGKEGAPTLTALCSRLRAKGVRLLETSSHKGTPLDEVELKGALAIFIGNEGAGLPRELAPHMDETVAIPHAPQVESLNAGVAASIVLWEAARGRGR